MKEDKLAAQVLTLSDLIDMHAFAVFPDGSLDDTHLSFAGSKPKVKVIISMCDRLKFLNVRNN